MRLRRENPNLYDARVLPIDPARESDAAAPRRPTVALVMDDAELAQALAQHLAPYGADLRPSRDGRELLERLRAGAPVELLIVDLDAPAEGFRRFLVELWRGPGRELPIIAVGDDPPAFLRMLTTVRAVFRHPLPELALVGAVRDALARRRPASR